MNIFTTFTRQQVNTFDAMKGIAMMLVLLIHADLRECNVDKSFFSDIYYEACCLIFPFAAVPVFFFLSGFFLFKNYDFIKKLTPRFYSVIIPYLIWCAWGIVILFVLQRVLGFESLFTGNKLKLLSDFSLLDYVRSFWDIRDGAPIISTLWFLRDLIILILLSPIINFLIKKASIVFIALIFIAYMLSFHVSILSFSSIFFFSAGGYVMIKGIDVFRYFKSVSKWVIILFIILLFASIYAYVEWPSGYEYIKKLYILSFIPMLYVICNNAAIYNSSIIQKLCAASFFIYLFHEPILGYIQKLTFKFIHVPIWAEYVLMWLLPLVIFLISYSIYLLLKNKFPKFLNVIIGTRK